MPVLNCHSVLPVSSSSATNSPVSLPVNTSPPPVASMPAELGRSVSGTSHFFSPVSGFDRHEVAEHVARLDGRLARPITPVEFAAEDLRFRRRELLDARQVPRLA